MGILNRTPDSFYDKGATFALDATGPPGRASWWPTVPTSSTSAGSRPARARGDGARGAGPGGPGHRRPARPLRRAAVGRHLAGLGGQGGLLGRRRGRQRHQRVRRSRLPAGGRRRRRHGGGHPHPPRPADPRPRAGLRRRGGHGQRLPRRAGRPGPRRRHRRRPRSCSTPGSTSGKTADQSLTLLRASDRLAELGYPLLLSASNKTFLGVVCGLAHRRAAGRPRWPPPPSGVALGCRIVRVHDVAAHRQVRDVVAAILRAGRRP